MDGHSRPCFGLGAYHPTAIDHGGGRLMTTFRTLESPTRCGVHDVTGKAGANDQGGRHETHQYRCFGRSADDRRDTPLVEKRDERGLSQSTENAILLVGAVSIATVVVTVIKGYVSSNLPK